MAFGQNINFTTGQGGLGTPLAGQDFISGMVFYSSTLPSGFSYSIAQEIFSLQQAETLGIVGNYSDETEAIVHLTVGATASGIPVTVTIPEPNIQSTINNVVLTTYTTQTTDTTTTILASNLATSINVNNGQGYVATSTGGTVSIYASSGFGSLINGVTPVITQSTTIVTSGTFSGGVNSKRIFENYQISEYFRMQPQGQLWVMYATYNAGSIDFTQLNSLQNQSGNVIRQFGVFNLNATSASQINADCDAIQTVCNTMFNSYSPASVIYAPNIYSISNLATLPNLRARSDNFVSGVIGQDGGNTGAFLSIMLGQSVPCYGAVLGAVSLSKVSDSIGWVSKYNLSGSTELSTPAMSNNQLYATLYSSSYNELVQLDSYGWIFLQTRPNLIGTWVNDSHCAVSITSAYNYIEKNRTIDKVLRNTYLELAPLINSPELLNADGTLSAVAIAIFENSEKPSMDAMIQNSEISAYDIIINPNQNVQSTGTIAITINIVGIGVARQINVSLNYVISI